MPGPILPQTAQAMALTAETVSLKRAAWAFGCAKKDSDEERLLRDLLLRVVGKAHREVLARIANALMYGLAPAALQITTAEIARLDAIEPHAWRGAR